MSDPSPLVIVRCKRCGEALGSLDTMPDDWSGKLTVLRCPKCVIPSPGRLVRILKQQKAAAGFAMAVEIPLADLRHHALKAKSRGRTVSVSIAPRSAARW
jgi:hypothetical protein